MSDEISIGEFKKMLKFTPLCVSDRVDVVRCKDCKYAQTDVMYHDIWCDGIIRKPDWFCADGERRDEDAQGND